MLIKRTNILAKLTLLALIGCSGITAKPTKNVPAHHDGTMYRTKKLVLEVTPAPEGFKIYPYVQTGSDLKVSDAYYSYIIEKENHSIHLVKKKDYFLAEGNFKHDRTYRIHLNVHHDGIDEDVTFKLKY